MTQLLPSFDIGKLPVDFDACGVARCCQRVYLPVQGFHIGDPSPQSIALEYTQFDFGHIKPAGVFGRVGKSQLSRETAGFLWCKSLIQRAQTMCVEIVLDHFDPLGFRITLIYQPFENLTVITSSPPRGYEQMAKPGQWLKDNEEVSRATMFVLEIYPFGLAGLHWLTFAHLSQQLFELFIQANYRVVRVVFLFVEIQH